MEGLSARQIVDEVEAGGKFVIYPFCISLIILTFRRGSAVHFIRPGQSSILVGLPYLILTLLLGWWGLPWGPIRSFQCLYVCLAGGKDITAQLMKSISH